MVMIHDDDDDITKRLNNEELVELALHLFML